MQIQAKRDLTVSTLFINIDQLITFFAQNNGFYMYYEK